MLTESYCGGDLLHYPNFIMSDSADIYYKQLQSEIQWSQSKVRIFGKEHFVPRLTAWYGDAGCSYKYSGVTNEPISWIAPLLSLKEKITDILALVNFNSVLLNLYRDGNDKMGWHADNEIELGVNPVIASISFGVPRYFDLKHRDNIFPRVRLELKHGSLLIMQGQLQNNWLHQVPAQKRITEPRINLTFRQIIK